MNRKVVGFTLIELMVAVAIFAIIASIAIPSYRDFMFKSRRADAKAGLSSLQLAMEKYRTNCVRYATGLTTDSDTCVTGNYMVRNLSSSPDGYYDLSIVNPTTYGYSLRAAPASTGAQYGDKCGNFYINQNSVKWVTSTSSGYTSDMCW